MVYIKMSRRHTSERSRSSTSHSASEIRRPTSNHSSRHDTPRRDRSPLSSPRVSPRARRSLSRNKGESRQRHVTTSVDSFCLQPPPLSPVTYGPALPPRQLVQVPEWEVPYPESASVLESEPEVVLSARDTVLHGWRFAQSVLPSDFWAQTHSENTRRFIPELSTPRVAVQVQQYPNVTVRNFTGMSNLVGQLKESFSLPLSTVTFPAAAYKPTSSLWLQDKTAWTPFTAPTSRPTPSLWDAYRASSMAFDVVSYARALAEAQEVAVRRGFDTRTEIDDFAQSTTSMVQATADALALTSLALSNVTLAMRSRILLDQRLAPPQEVYTAAMTSDLSEVSWFGPQAAEAVQRHKTDPATWASAVGVAVSRAVKDRPPFRQRAERGGRGYAPRDGRSSRRGRGRRQLFEAFPRRQDSSRGRSAGRGRGGGKASATTTSA